MSTDLWYQQGYVNDKGNPNAFYQRPADGIWHQFPARLKTNYDIGQQQIAVPDEGGGIQGYTKQTAKGTIVFSTSDDTVELTKFLLEDCGAGKPFNLVVFAGMTKNSAGTDLQKVWFIYNATITNEYKSSKPGMDVPITVNTVSNTTAATLSGLSSINIAMTGAFEAPTLPNTFTIPSGLYGATLSGFAATI